MSGERGSSRLPPTCGYASRVPGLTDLSGASRAIIELILSHGQSYRDVSSTLDMPVARVRALAGEALVALAPAEADRVDEARRGEVADYLLLQQSEDESTATKAELSRSEPARAWALAILPSLRDLYRDGAEPRIPDAISRNDRGTEGAPGGDGATAAATGPQTTRAGRWPLVAALTGLLALAALVALVVVLLDSDPQAAEGETSAAADTQSIARVPLEPSGDVKAPGAALLYRQGDEAGIFLKGHLPPLRGSDVYQLWLLNSPDDAVPVLELEPSRTGRYFAEGPLPDGYESYRFLDVSREPADDDGEHSGDSVVQAPVWTRSLARVFGRL